MQNQNTDSNTSVVQGLTLAHEIGQFTADLDMGIAIYSKDHVLVTVNDAFYRLHGVQKEDIGIGSSLKDLMHKKLSKKDRSIHEVDETYARWINALESDGKHSRDVESNGGKLIRISRSLRSNGMILEVVQEQAADAASVQLPATGHLSHANEMTVGYLMEAVNGMKDGMAIFDPDGVLMAYNKNYLALNPSVKHLIKVGMTHSELISALYDSGEVELSNVSKDEFLAMAEKERLTPSGATSHMNSDGTFVSFSGHRLDDGSTVFSCSDITKLRSKEIENRELGQTLQEQGNHMQLALSAMSQGICMFDENSRVMFMNEQYANLTGVDDVHCRVGTRRIDLLRNAMESSDEMTPQELDAYFEKLEREGFPKEETTNLHRLGNGKIMEVSNRPLPDGRTIVTSVDVTLREKDSAEINEQQDRLREALKSMSQGLGLYDDQQRLIICNDQYLKLSGIDPALGKPGTPREEMVRNSIDNGYYESEDIDKDIAHLTKETVSNNEELKFFQHLTNGVILEIHNRPLKNGRIIVTKTDVTERENSAKKIAEQKQHLDEVLSSTSHGICLYNENQEAIFMNDRYIELFHMDPDLAKHGASRRDLVLDTIRRGEYTPEDAERLQEIYEKLDFPNTESSFKHNFADGKIAELINMPLENGNTIATGMDVTQRERDSKIIAEQQLQIDHAFANMAQGLCLFDKEDRVVTFNDKYVEMTGADPEFVAPGVKRLDLVRSAVKLNSYSEKEAQDILKRYENEDFRNIESIRLLKRDNGRICEVHNQPLTDGTSVVLITDVTVREKNLVKIEQHTKSLERSNAELQDFAYVASHDLQEPLRKIEAFGDRLLKKYGDDIPEDGQMYLERMQNAANRMRQLINDLLSYSRVTSKARPFEPTDLNEVVSGVLSDIQMRLEDSGGTVDVKGLETVDCDPMQMRQLFQNLISNALKFIKEDEKPLIKVHGAIVDVQDAMGKDIKVHQIKIIDNGIGFENRFKDQIFAIFKRLHGRMDYEGTGIGLSTCRKIVERHNGTIDADGVPDVGATFIIEMPIKNANAEEL